MVTFEEFSYKNLGKCIKMTDGKSEIVVSLDVGPRVIKYAVVGGENVFGELEVDFKKPTQNGFEVFGDLGVWNNFGGHRLWVSPEDRIRTKFPDNHPCEYEIRENSLYVKQMKQPYADVLCEMEFSFDENGDIVVKHFVTNTASYEQEIAPWAISVMGKSGTLILPMRSEDKGVLPNRNFSFWTYSNLSDERFCMKEKYVTLTQKPDAQKAFKFGMGKGEGVAVYAINSYAFIKFFDHDENAKYPDMGCSFEAYTDKNILEVESLSPLTVLKSGERAEHTERWRIKEVLWDKNPESLFEGGILK